MNLDEVIARCALGDVLDRDNRKLSGGQRQRLLLAIALINDPDLVFLDEPTTGLDPQARRNFWGLIRDIRAQGKTIVLTTHYMEEAYELCDTIAIMDHGRIIAQDAPDALLAAHFDDVVVQIHADDIPRDIGEREFGGASGASIPIISTRRTETQISLKDGYTMGLGGLLQASSIEEESKVPLLHKIPGLGAAFRHKEKDGQKMNLMLLRQMPEEIVAPLIRPAFGRIGYKM